MSDELPHDIDDHVARVFGQADEAPEFYAARRASDLFEPFGPDCRGLGVGRPTEVAQLLEGRPRKFRFLTAAQLRSAGSDGVEAVDRSRQQRRGQFREQDAVSRHVYSQVAAGRGSEYGFRHGRDLATAVGYAEGDLAAVPPTTLDRFVGLGHPWVMGRAEPGWRCLDVGCGVGVDVFVAAGQVGPRGQAVGVDLAPGMVRAVNDAATAAGVGHASAIEGSASAVPLADGSVDLVTANGLLVLVREPQQVLAEIARVLRPGGRLCFADTVFGEAATSGVVDDLEYWNRLTHGRPFIHEVVALLERADFTDVEVGPQVDPFEPTVDHGQVWGRTFAATRPGRPAT